MENQEFKQYSELVKRAKQLEKDLSITFDDAFKILSEGQTPQIFEQSSSSSKTPIVNDDKYGYRITSSDIHSLIDLNNENPNLTGKVLKQLYEELLKYEHGESLHPFIDFIIGSVKDTERTEGVETGVEDSVEKRIEMGSETDVETGVEIRAEETGVEDTIEQRRQKIRDSWTKKHFESSDSN